MLVLAWLLFQPAQGATIDLGREVHLPPFIVSDQIHVLRWRFAEAGHFQVLSLCSDETTAEFIRQTYRMEQQLDWILPPEFRLRTSLPVTYILCDESMQQRLDRDIPVEMFRGRPRGEGERGGPAVNYFTSPNLELRDTDSDVNFALLDSEFLTLNHLIPTADHVAALLRQRTPPLPHWYIAGFLHLFGSISFPNVDEHGRDVGVGDRDGILREGINPSFLWDDAFLAAPLLPMEDLLQESHPPAGPQDAVDRYDRQWTRQSALFVLNGLNPSFGEPPSPADLRRRDAFGRFLRLTSSQPATEAVFRACFHMSYEQMRRQLADSPLLQSPSHYQYLAIPPEPPVVTLRDATASEVARIKGDWERLEADSLAKEHPGLERAYQEHARRTLWNAYDSGDRDPRLLAAMGLFECDRGDDQAALPLLDKAVAAEVVRPKAYFELARIRFARATAQPDGKNGKISSDQAAAILSLLAVGRRQSPTLEESCALFAKVLLASEAPPSPADVGELRQELLLFPENAALQSSAFILRAQPDH